MSYKDVLKNIALSSPITFVIKGRKIRSGVLYQLKSDPKKMIMLCRYAYANRDYYDYTLHKFKTTVIEEIDCESYSSADALYNAVNPDDLVYAKWANELVLEKAKQWITHLQVAGLDNI